MGLCPVKGLPSGLDAHAALATISSPIQGQVQVSPTIYVPVSRSPVSREASRDLWRSIGPSDDGRVQTANAVSASTLSTNIMDGSIFMFRAKRSLYPQHQTDESAETSVSDQRGRKTAELHTSGAKRAETWRGEVEW